VSLAWTEQTDFGACIAQIHTIVALDPGSHEFTIPDNGRGGSGAGILLEVEEALSAALPDGQRDEDRAKRVDDSVTVATYLCERMLLVANPGTRTYLNPYPLMTPLLDIGSPQSTIVRRLTKIDALDYLPDFDFLWHILLPETDDDVLAWYYAGFSQIFERKSGAANYYKAQDCSTNGRQGFYSVSGGDGYIETCQTGNDVVSVLYTDTICILPPAPLFSTSLLEETAQASDPSAVPGEYVVVSRMVRSGSPLAKNTADPGLYPGPPPLPPYDAGKPIGQRAYKPYTGGAWCP